VGFSRRATSRFDAADADIDTDIDAEFVPCPQLAFDQVSPCRRFEPEIVAMRIAMITAGAAGRYCGNCLRDNTLALALRRLGEEVVLAPIYTPIRTDGENASVDRVFFGGLRVWLEEKSAIFRLPLPWIDRLLSSRLAFRTISRFSGGTNPRVLGDLTVSMLSGESGHQKRDLDELAYWLGDFKPDVIHLSNLLLVGFVRELRRALGIPVVCGLQAEDSFVDYLPPAAAAKAMALIAERGAEVDAFIATSEYWARAATERFQLPRDRVRWVSSGVPIPTATRSFEKDSESSGGGVEIGYLARITKSKGPHLLVEAFESLARRPACSAARLAIAGFVAREERRYVRDLESSWRGAGLADRVRFLGTVSGPEKETFLGSIDVLCVPTLYPDPKGLSVIEGMAHGVPFVAPRHGVFPELAAASGAGLLFEPGDVGELRDRLAELVEDGVRRRHLGTLAREFARENLSDERMARETLSIYREVIAAS
jgi:glycosyltransferase involved in cell wall biosynthesis